MPDEQAKIVKDIPRDLETIELFKNLPEQDLCRRDKKSPSDLILQGSCWASAEMLK